MTSPQGNTYHNLDNVESGNFAFTAAESGDYTTCFWAPEHKPPSTVTVDFDWSSGVSSRDWGKVAKKGQIEVSSEISHLGSGLDMDAFAHCLVFFLIMLSLG